MFEIGLYGSGFRVQGLKTVRINTSIFPNFKWIKKGRVFHLRVFYDVDYLFLHKNELCWILYILSVFIPVFTNIG